MQIVVGRDPIIPISRPGRVAHLGSIPVRLGSRDTQQAEAWRPFGPACRSIRGPLLRNFAVPGWSRSSAKTDRLPTRWFGITGIIRENTERRTPAYACENRVGRRGYR